MTKSRDNYGKIFKGYKNIDSHYNHLWECNPHCNEICILTCFSVLNDSMP